MTDRLHKSLDAVREFLVKNSHEDFKQHGIKAKSDGNHIILDYDMIDVKWHEPYGFVCRGLVLDAHTLDVLGFGLDKFFNAGEGHAAPIDWNSARIFEKVDGTMVKRWWSPYSNQFEYTTRRQLPDDIAQNQLQDMGMTWKELIEKCLGSLPGRIDQGKHETVTFEVMSPANRVVVQHTDFHGRLLARRDNRTLEEVDVSQHFHAPKTFAFSSSEECTEFANTLSGLESEGFVVVDGNFNRVKIKGRDYLALHHLKDSAGNSLKSLILVVRRGEWDEVATAFPEFIPAMDAIGLIIDHWMAEHIVAYEKLKGIEEQKDFALAVQAERLPFPGLLFSTRAGKAESIKDAVNKLDDAKFVRAIKPLVEKAGITVISFEEDE